MGSLTMTPLTITITITLHLLSLLTVTAHPGGYWWMGREGAFDGPADNNDVADKLSEGYNKSPSLEISEGYNKSPSLAAGGYYGSQASSSISVSQDLSGQLAGVTADSGELPVTECPVGWKCVAEFFCDVTATMVGQRVELSKAQIAIRGDLIQCMNQATGQFNVCCRQPQETSPSTEVRPEVRPEVTPEVRPDPERIQFEELREPISCPEISVLPPIQLCANRKSTCWSAGLPDVDCLDNALCCFDGCANVCLGKGPVAGNPGPQNNPRQSTTAAPAPLVSAQQNIPENLAEKTPSNTVSNSAISPQVSQEAAAQPFITCPSAMKCVPRVNCDFNGVMVNTKVILSALQETQRVPLIPCINPARGSAVDVCCRDPNYKDPWPEMETKKTQDQPNIAINHRVSSPDQALINGVPAAGGSGGYGR